MRRSNNPEFGTPPVDCGSRLRALKALGAAVAKSRLIETNTPNLTMRTSFVAGEPHVVIKDTVTRDEQQAPACVGDSLIIPADSVTKNATGEQAFPAPDIIFVSPSDARIAVGSTPGTYRSAMTG